jgi:hypothetical protein
MTSERMRRRLDGFLDEAEAAAARQEWELVEGAARAALAIDETNEDALTFLKIATANDKSRRASDGAQPPSPSPQRQRRFPNQAHSPVDVIWCSASSAKAARRRYSLRTMSYWTAM